MEQNKTKIKSYFSLVKFSHTIFAMPFALIGFFLALKFEDVSFSWNLLVLIVLCMVFARNAAMAFNRYLDKDIDQKNPRTIKREIPDGVIKPKAALIFVIINSLLFMITTYFINKITLYLSPVALFVILFYSYTKKYTALCHFVLGLGLSLAPIGAYLSVSGEFSLLPIIFSCIVLFWVSGFDMIYALQDEEFDKSNKLKSIPALIGKKDALILSIIIHFLAAALIIVAGVFFLSSFLYWLGSIIFICLLIYQHIIVKPNDLRKINLAFFSLNGISSIVFSVFTILSLYFHDIVIL